MTYIDTDINAAAAALRQLPVADRVASVRGSVERGCDTEATRRIAEKSLPSKEYKKFQEFAAKRPTVNYIF